MSKKYSTEYIKSYFNDFGYELLESEYKNAKQKLLTKCNKGHLYHTNWNRFQQGHRCPECKKEKLSNQFKYDYKYVKSFIESCGYKLLSNYYINSNTKIEYKCPKNHIFEMNFSNFKNGQRCPICNREKSSEKQRKSIDDIKEELLNHGCILIDNETNYINSKSEVTYYCKCGKKIKKTRNSYRKSPYCEDCDGAIRITYDQVKQFFQDNGCELLTNKYVNNYYPLEYICRCGEKNVTTWSTFKKSGRCPKCSIKYFSEQRKHSYDYVFNYFAENDCELLSVEYVNNQTPLKYRCKCGRIDYITFGSFQRGSRCKYCANEKLRKERSLNINYVKEKFEENGFVLLENKYINARTKMKCKCKEHPDIIQYKTYDNLIIGGYGCPYCHNSLSKGEEKVQKYLAIYNMTFSNEFTFDDCSEKQPLPFDFVVFNNDDVRLLIEYDGGQHFQSVDYFGGVKKFKEQQYHDKIKNQYCIDNNIPLIRIPYWEFDNIEYILENVLKHFNLIESDNTYDKEIVLKYLVDENFDQDDYIALAPCNKRR